MNRFFFLFLLLAPGLLFAQPLIEWQKCFGGTKNDLPGGLVQTRDGGYIMAGQTKSDDGDVISNHGNYDLWIVKTSAKGAIEWQKSYGGSGDDGGGVILQTFDGGYIIAASTNSNDGDLKGISHTDGKQSDIWVYKIDSLGAIIWQKTFGGSKNDFLTSMDHAGEGEFIISAITESADGDVQGFHGGSGFDTWIFEISESGTIGWQKIFGGTNDDEAYSLIQTRDGGFAFAGLTYSHDGDLSGRQTIDTTSADIWFVKLSSTGGIQWQKTYGGSKFDEGFSLTQTFDHGFAIAGLTFSEDGDVSGIHTPAYFSDCWIVKVDNAGAIQWQKALGGSQGDAAYSILQTSDSGYVVSASTASNDGDVTGFHGISDCWIFKLGKSGDLRWQKTLGGSWTDANIGSGIMQTADQGFLVATVTSSHDGDVSGLHGDSTQSDIWLVKLSQDPSAVKDISNIHNGSISLYPNPGIGFGKILYDLDKPAQVRIEIFNPLGENLRTLINTKEETGNHEHAFDISRLPSGTYFFRIQIDGKSMVRAFDLLK